MGIWADLIGQARQIVSDYLTPCSQRESDLEARNTRLSNYALSLEARIRTLEVALTTSENARADELAANEELRSLIARISAEHLSVLDQLQAAREQAATAQADAEQLITDDMLADTQRTRQLIDELKAAFPGEVPEVPTPAPGEAAEEPAPAEPAGEPVPAPTDPAPPAGDEQSST